MINSLKRYGTILAAFVLLYLFSSTAYHVVEDTAVIFGEEGHKFLLFVIIFMLFGIGILVYHLSKPTILPSFVLAILFGFAAHPFLRVLTENEFTVNVLVTIGAVFILFGGGLDTPFNSFKRLFRYIFSIAFAGTLLTALLLSLALSGIAQLVGIELSTATIVLLGAALASTDPAAIIPSFAILAFRRKTSKYIAISESALNDVVGAILTITFLSVFKRSPGIHSIMQAYGHLATQETAIALLKIILVGALVGMAGFFLLAGWQRLKEKNQIEEESDAAFFMGMPILIYTASQLFGGSGFLAAFLSPLLFNLKEHIKHVEQYFNSTVQAFMKPMIFILLGAIIDLRALMAFAPVGILAALIFMCVIRPLIVFVTIGPFLFFTKELTIKDLLFLSIVRETGVIPAVLLVTLAASGLPGAEQIVPIGMWVILLTLVILPPITPWIAKKLGIAEPLATPPAVRIGGGSEPTAVLVSRGSSFVHRLPEVVKWSFDHNINSIAILHSPEDKFSEAFVAEHRAQAQKLFDELNQMKKNADQPKIRFEFIAEPGELQQNIRRYVGAHNNISIIFAGNKMLDFRADEIKKLQVPFLFME